jgi:hypothetical protein
VVWRDREYGISVVLSDGVGKEDAGRPTSTHAGPDMRIMAIAALPEAEERARIVSSDGGRISCCWSV